MYGVAAYNHFWSNSRVYFFPTKREAEAFKKVELSGYGDESLYVFRVKPHQFLAITSPDTFHVGNTEYESKTE